jgi:hypothetical protein
MKQVAWFVFGFLFLISENSFPVAEVLPTPQDIPLEIIETKNYTPDFGINDDEWSRLASDEKMFKACFALLRRVGDSDSFTFVNDKTGKNIIKFRSLSFPRYSMICEGNNIWVNDYVSDDDGKMILTKYTVNGDMLFRIKFGKPAAPKGEFLGNIMDSTLKSEDGYLSFEWWFRKRNVTTQDGKQHIKQILKVRLREPDNLTSRASMAMAEECPKSGEQIKTITHTHITECPAATIIVEDDQYLEKYQNCPGYTEDIQYEALFYQVKGSPRLSLPSLGALYPKNEKLQGFDTGEIQCKGNTKISVTYLNGGNCGDCAHEVLYTFDPTGELKESRLEQAKGH